MIGPPRAGAAATASLVGTVSDARAESDRTCPHCGGEHPPHLLKCTETDMVLPLQGRVLDGKFRLMRQIGKGGMASVWLAVNTRVERLVAIKLIRPEVVRRTDTVKRFRSEARAAGRIGHANICDILDFGDSTIGPYIVMEYLRGRSLAEWIRADGPLSVGAAVAVVRQALAGLAAAHREGIIHRDLKPENLFIHEPDEGEPIVKLMDFGVSKFTDGSSEVETADGALLGTPEYMSPEQFKGAAHADERTDVWAVGAILYRALTGKNAFAGPTIAATLLMVSAEEPTPIRTHAPNVPQALADIIHKCLDKTAERRFESAVALSEALAPFADDTDELPSGAVDAARDDGDGPSSGDALTRLKTTKQAVVPERRADGTDRRAMFVLAAVLLTVFAASWYALRDDGPEPADETTAAIVEPTPDDTAPRRGVGAADDGGNDDAGAAIATGPVAGSTGGATADAASSAAGPSADTEAVPSEDAGDDEATEPVPAADTGADEPPEPVRPSGDGGKVTPPTTDPPSHDPPSHDPPSHDPPSHDPPSHDPPPSDPPVDPAGTVRFGNYLALTKQAGSMDHTAARKHCEALAAAHHLGISSWRLAGPTIADRLIGTRKVKRGTYWTSARWKGRAKVIKLPSGDKKSRDAERFKARPLCVAKWP